MKSFILTLKAILFYITAFTVLLFISGVDSVYDMGYKYFAIGLLVCVILCYLCYKLISVKDLETITFYRWLEHKLK